jgi:hypothetical protein
MHETHTTGGPDAGQPDQTGSPSRATWVVAAAAAGAVAAELLILTDWSPIVARIGANHNESLIRS